MSLALAVSPAFVHRLLQQAAPSGAILFLRVVADMGDDLERVKDDPPPRNQVGDNGEATVVRHAKSNLEILFKSVESFCFIMRKD